MSEVKGHWKARWEPVVESFRQNIREAGEEAAALTVYRAGKPVIRLWAGESTPGTPWQENTRVNLFSASKGVVALAVLQLVEAGHLSLDQPVSDLWPAFAQAGKQDITVRMLLSHRSGLSALQERAPEAAIFDWNDMTARVEAARPWWTPDSAQGYSPFLFGWALGEVVRRAAGVERFSDWVETSIARPLGLGLTFGAAGDAPVADSRPLKRGLGLPSNGADSQSLGKIMKADPRGVTNQAFSNPVSLLTASNSEAWRAAEIPAANGYASATDLAAIYGALANGGQAANARLLSEDMIALCAQELTFEDDRVLGLPLRFGHGFMLSQKRDDCRFGRGRGAFGHPGAGGCLGFADPDYGIGFGYVTGRMGPSLLIDSRPQRLIDALYTVLGDTL
ncbi:serine hydrolase domain-containing protein [Marinimicrobium sp. ARAG 43.8]|uniref:serine hydrolase domain-containing protein n=1 Tax=Marinimicrobium sp. ARAG 43.8 TaxID=3418719 RepID=UPI003CF1F7F5